MYALVVAATALVAPDSILVLVDVSGTVTGSRSGQKARRSAEVIDRLEACVPKSRYILEYETFASSRGEAGVRCKTDPTGAQSQLRGSACAGLEGRGDTPLVFAVEGATPRYRQVVLITDGIQDNAGSGDEASLAAEKTRLRRSLDRIGTARDVRIALVSRERNTDDLLSPRAQGGVSVADCSRPGSVECDELLCLWGQDPDPTRFAVLVGDDRRFSCSGVLITAGWVLTARHCLPATRIARSLKTAAGRSRSVRNVRSAYPGPDQADLALLELALPTGVVPPFPEIEASGLPPFGGLTFVGFGARGLRGRAGFGTLKVFGLKGRGWNCTTSEALTTGCRPDTEFVLRNGDGRDTCSGDSGGPLFTVECEGREIESCRYGLVGLTSRPVRNARALCGSGGVYVRLDRYLQWIEATTGLKTVGG
ncbi:MAG: trypsin-like serine protease [Myxococcota bacterium]